MRRALAGLAVYDWGMTRFHLPVFKGPAAAVSAKQLVQRTLNAQAAADVALGESTTLDFGLAIYNAEYGEIWAANHLADVSLPVEMDAEGAFGEVEALYKGKGAVCFKWEMSPHNLHEGVGRMLEGKGWRKHVHRFFSLQKVVAQEVRGDLTVIPVRASLGKLEELIRAEGNSAELMHRAFARHFDDPHMDGFLALEGTKAVGMVALFTDGDLGYISDLNTHPEHRRQKVGATLLMHAFELAARSRHRYVTLLTADDNAGAIGLYERIGFVEIGKAETYLRPRG